MIGLQKVRLTLLTGMVWGGLVQGLHLQPIAFQVTFSFAWRKIVLLLLESLKQLADWMVNGNGERCFILKPPTLFLFPLHVSDFSEYDLFRKQSKEKRF